MLSSVLRSKKAIQVNIQIMRVFTRFRKIYLDYDELKKAIYSLAKKHEEDVTLIVDEIDRLNRLLESIKPKKQMGFKKED